MGRYDVLREYPLDWQQGRDYDIAIRVEGNHISALCEGVCFCYTDEDEPYMEGGIGVSVRSGSHIQLESIEIKA